MRIKSGDMEKTRAAFDFIGINLYYRTVAAAVGSLERVTHLQDWLFPVRMTSGLQGPKTDFGWEVWPKALYDMVMRITRDYNRPVIEITENGCAYGDAPDANGVIHDARRIDYHRGYLAALAQAIAEGADVRGYHAWSLLDNFEWAEGFSQHFGLAYTDFKTLQRTIKDSGRWYATVAEKNRAE
jgi:beta-glucosidase